MRSLSIEIYEEINKGHSASLDAIERAVKRVLAVENAEMGNVPTTEMRNAYERFIAKFSGMSVNTRDAFFHGYLAGRK
jgi:hypothetical protein